MVPPEFVRKMSYVFPATCRASSFMEVLVNRATSHLIAIYRSNLLESWNYRGRVAQLGEHLLCKQGVAGSIPATSTNFFLIAKDLEKSPRPERSIIRALE